MKINILRTGLIALIILNILGGVLLFTPKQAHAAGTASFSISPSSASYVEGSIITVKVYENSNSDQVNAVQANVDFNGSYLQFVSQTYGTSANSQFSFCSPTGNGLNGTMVELGCAVPNINVTGSQLVEQITFKAANNVGIGSIKMDSSSSIQLPNGGGEDWDGSTAILANFSITAPPATCPTGESGTPPNCITPTPPSTGGGSGGGGTTTGNTKSVIPSNNNSVDSNKTVAATPNTALTTGTSTTAQSDNLPTPTTNSADGAFSSNSNELTISIKVVNDSDKPVSGAAVTLNNVTSTTNSLGIAKFTAVPGDYKVSVKGKGIKSYTKSLIVTPSENNQYTLAAQSSGLSVDIIVLIILLFFAVDSIAGGLYFRAKHHKNSMNIFGGGSGAVVAAGVESGSASNSLPQSMITPVVTKDDEVSPSIIQPAVATQAASPEPQTVSTSPITTQPLETPIQVITPTEPVTKPITEQIVTEEPSKPASSQFFAPQDRSRDPDDNEVKFG